ncbi:MAG: hypothetical protein IPM97_12755 [Bdellovibrionaceae bacterium]|nr:hypothetical protein [Pseudobdellovibrionaceae bacterium]
MKSLVAIVGLLFSVSSLAGNSADQVVLLSGKVEIYNSKLKKFEKTTTDCSVELSNFYIFQDNVHSVPPEEKLSVNYKITGLPVEANPYSEGRADGGVDPMSTVQDYYPLGLASGVDVFITFEKQKNRDEFFRTPITLEKVIVANTSPPKDYFGQDGVAWVYSCQMKNESL